MDYQVGSEIICAVVVIAMTVVFFSVYSLGNKRRSDIANNKNT